MGGLIITKNGKQQLRPTGPRFLRCLGADSEPDVSADVDYICNAINHTALGTMTAVNDRITLGWFIAPPWPVTLARIGVECTAAASGNVRLGVYQDAIHEADDQELPRATPGLLLYDSGDIAASVALLTAAPALALKPGWRYWIAANFSAGITLRSITVMSPMGMNINTGTTYLVNGHWDRAYGAMPSRVPGLLAGRVSSSNHPVMRYQFA